jgi:hypothetical protein
MRVKRTVSTAQPSKKPLFTLEIRKVIAALPGNLQGAPTSVSFRRCWEHADLKTTLHPRGRSDSCRRSTGATHPAKLEREKQDIREGLEAKEGDEDL